jgi:hypothetical protein
VLEAQVRRMIADERSESLMKDFPGQWLQLRNLDKVTPDLLMFPDFDDNVRQAFRRETELLFTSIVREDRSTLDLLNADYTFVNERLARHYGIRGVYGSRFRRVHVEDPNRHGLLGHGSFLSLTSVANRTSPIIRGKYVVSNLLNTPPLPPPANVPPLEDSAPKDRPSTVRQQLELHRANPVCASCHRTIDPVGFALENFNAVGQWQSTTKDGLKIDSAGLLAGAAGATGGFRRHRDGKDVDLCPRPGSRARGPVGCAEHRERRREEELRHAIDRFGNCEKFSVPDAH